MNIPATPALSALPDRFRAVMLGATGGIGGALADRISLEPHLGELVTFSRSHDGFDLLDEDSVAAAAHSLLDHPVHLLICATGILTTEGRAPEKSLRQIDPEVMLAQFRTNAVGPALIAKHFLPLLDRKHRSIAAFLSARVGSIGDNRLGGWISYRSAKAALNQIVRTSAIEVTRTHPNAVVAAVHPGTVRTALSDPYARSNRTSEPADAAAAILAAVGTLQPERSGSFMAYDGTTIPW